MLHIHRKVITISFYKARITELYLKVLSAIVDLNWMPFALLLYFKSVLTVPQTCFILLIRVFRSAWSFDSMLTKTGQLTVLSGSIIIMGPLPTQISPFPLLFLFLSFPVSLLFLSSSSSFV